MAAAVYSIYIDRQNAGTDDFLTSNVKCVAVDTADYTFSAAHQDLADVPAGARVATSGNLASKTVSGGVYDAADFTFTGVSGDQFEALIYYIDTAVEATSTLICYDDGISATTPDGGNINVTINASNGIMKIPA